MQKFWLFFLFAGLSACTPPVPNEAKVDAAGIENLIQTEPSLQIVDLRAPEELRTTGKIEGAQNINFYSPDFEQQISKLNPSEPVLLYCKTGKRSRKAFHKLRDMGFRQVYAYTGGMDDWKAKGKKTVQN